MYVSHMPYTHTHTHTHTHIHTHTHTLTHTHTHSGGINLTFIGTNLDVVQNPVLVVNDPQYLDGTNVSHKKHTYS